MDAGKLNHWQQRWTERLHGVSAERLAREEPLRAKLLGQVLIAAAGALVLQAALLPFARAGLGWFAWATLEPALFLLLAAWAARRRRTLLATNLLLVALSHAAAFTTSVFGLRHFTAALLTLTIVVCGLLIGAYFVRTWTIICCVLLLWIGWNHSQRSAPGTADWPSLLGWCGVYVATGWLVTLFSRHLERLLAAGRAAEERERSAIVAERTRFAREIHDSLAQGFTGVVVQLNAAEGHLASQPERARRHLDRARDLARQSLDEARRSARALRPGVLDDGNLLAAIERIACDLTAGTGIAFAARLEGDPYALSEETEAQLLRIGQEALTNAVRHARQRRIEVHLRYAPRSAALEVRDDGCGIGGAPHAGCGLVNMAERARQLGGELKIHSRPGQGTSITATVPGA